MFILVDMFFQMCIDVYVCAHLSVFLCLCVYVCICVFDGIHGRSIFFLFVGEKIALMRSRHSPRSLCLTWTATKGSPVMQSRPPSPFFRRENTKHPVDAPFEGPVIDA